MVMNGMVSEDGQRRLGQPWTVWMEEDEKGRKVQTRWSRKGDADISEMKKKHC